jgi:cytoskeleton protein RodZ
MPNEEANKILPTVGETLKKAREKAGLSVADIAAKLHVAVKYVDGIEADDLWSLPQSLVFKRGYIRNYARLLKIPDDYIQQLLHAQGLIEVPVVKKVEQIIEKRQVTVRDKRVRWVTYAIILLFVILLISWWRSQMSLHQEPEVKAPVMNEPVAPAAVAPVKEEIKPTIVEHNAKQVEQNNSDSLLIKKHEVNPSNNLLENKMTPKVEDSKTTAAAKQSEKSIEVKATTERTPRAATQKRTDVANNLNFDSDG